MTYQKIIENNCNYHCKVRWWPKFAYHYTDIENALSILHDGLLYSRHDATGLNIMRNDNASRQVIDMTSSRVTSNVRFYFRPKTPTQYHNEGFKHPALRYQGDKNANVPVPVFFAFDLNELLSMDGVCFSEMSQAGGGSPLYNTPEDFARLNFDEIYGNGSMQDVSIEKKYRQAEIITPGPFTIDSCLVYVICRNEVEKITLLNLLRMNDKSAYTKYKDKITVCKNDMFENNGLYITECQYYNNVASIVYSDTYQKHSYIQRYKPAQTDLAPLNATADFEWVYSGSKYKRTINRQSVSFQIDYEKHSGIVFNNLIRPHDANVLYTTIRIEGKLMCYMGQQLAETALL